MRDRLTNKPRGFGFITFKDQEAADNACNDTHTLDGRTVGAAAAATTAATSAAAQRHSSMYSAGIIGVSLTSQLLTRCACAAD
jgi:RNA recognition motif-containing protein